MVEYWPSYKKVPTDKGSIAYWEVTVFPLRVDHH